MRVFLALDPPDDLRAALARLTDRLGPGRHVEEEDLHLTLVFAADAPRRTIEELDLSLGMFRPGPVILRVAGLDTFGTSHPRLVHAKVAPGSDLLHLQGKTATAARRAGMDLPRRRFVPHITLARFPHRMDEADHARLGRFLQAHGDFRPEPAPVTTMSLYASTLTGDGPRYDLLERYELT